MDDHHAFRDRADDDLNRFWRDCFDGVPGAIGVLSQFVPLGEIKKAMMELAAPQVAREMLVRISESRPFPGLLTCWQVIEDVETGSVAVRLNNEVRGKPWLDFHEGRESIIIRFDLPDDERSRSGHITALLGQHPGGGLVFWDWTVFLVGQIQKVIDMFHRETSRSAPRRGRAERLLWEQSESPGAYGTAVGAAFWQAVESEPDSRKWVNVMLGLIEAEIGVGVHSPAANKEFVPLSEHDLSGADPADILEARERLDELMAALADLPPAQRDAVFLEVRAQAEGIGFKEICLREGRSYDADRKALQRALQNLPGRQGRRRRRKPAS